MANHVFELIEKQKLEFDALETEKKRLKQKFLENNLETEITNLTSEINDQMLNSRKNK